MRLASLGLASRARGLGALLALAGCTEGKHGVTAPPPPTPELRAGAAVRDITPSFERYTDVDGSLRWEPGEPFTDEDGDDRLDSLWLGGFGPRQPTEVHDPLEARSVALAIGSELFTLTAVDALGLSVRRIWAIQDAALAQLDPALGLSRERMIVAATHTHAGPDTIGIFGPDSLEPAWNGAYLDQLVAATAESIVAAVAAREPAELSTAHALAGGEFVVDLDLPEVIDPEVGIVELRSTTGSVIATLTTTANHPEATWTANTEISADYLGVLRAALERDRGGIALAFVGALGLMQSPATTVTPGFARADDLGERYAALVGAALARAEPLGAGDLAPHVGFDAIGVPFQNGELFLGVTAGVVEGYEDTFYDDGSGLCSLGCFDLPTVVLRLGDHVTFVTIAGELTPELLLGGVASPPGYAGPYPDAPAEPHLLPYLETPERFVIGLAFAEVGYLYPKMTFEPEVHPGQHHGPGPEAASRLLPELCALAHHVNGLAR